MILSIGRSGSTLLQGILDSIGGYLIRGENDNACHRLFELTASLERRHEQFGATRARPVDRPEHPWYGIMDFDPDAFVASCRRLVLDTILRPERDTRVVGFKEVRHQSHQVPDLDGYLAYLTRLFPGVRFVVSRRHPSAMAQSGWWKDAQRDPIEYITSTQDRLIESALTAAAPAHIVEYESFVDDPVALRSLFDFLGEPFHEESVRLALGRRHSY